MAETTHQCPPEGSNVTPCCGLSPFELPPCDRMTLDASLVNTHVRDEFSSGAKGRARNDAREHARASESAPQPDDALIEDGAKAIQRHFLGSWEETSEARRDELRRMAADTFAAIERHRASESAPIAEQLAAALRALIDSYEPFASDGDFEELAEARRALAAFDASTASPQEG